MFHIRIWQVYKINFNWETFNLRLSSRSYGAASHRIHLIGGLDHSRFSSYMLKHSSSRNRTDLMISFESKSMTKF